MFFTQLILLFIKQNKNQYLRYLNYYNQVHGSNYYVHTSTKHINNDKP